MFLVIHRLKDFIAVKASHAKHQEYDDDDEEEIQTKREDSEKLAADRDDDDDGGAKTDLSDAENDDGDGSNALPKQQKVVTDPEKVGLYK